MKLFIVNLFVVAAICGGEAYSTENDGFDIEKVVTDPVSLKAFVGCFIDKADCDEVLTAFKKDMPEAVHTGCSKCNDRQKEMFKIFLDNLKEKLPVEYEEYKKKFDPENEHFSNFLASIAKS